MAHARGITALVCGAGLAVGCATAPPAPTGGLDGLEAEWFYVPGPYRTLQSIGDATRTAEVGPENDGRWTVRFGDPATTIVVARLEDGRPATARIADPRRDETVVFDPPLALVPRPGQQAPAAETTTITLYQGLWPEEDLDAARVKRRGEAERRFVGFEAASWGFEGREFPAQQLTHELVLSLNPATVRQVYVSVAVKGRGIVEESMDERVIVLGVRIGGREERVEVIEFIDGR